MAYIIGTYNKYDVFDRESARYKFELNGTWYAIKEVELEWGRPILPQYVDREQGYYWVYENYGDALQFVTQMKAMNR